MDKVTLFCIPYAGGSAVIYSKWKKYIDDCIEIVPIELAGRGKRFSEDQYDNIADAVDDVYEAIKNKIKGPYALFGHSMGSIIAYELAQKIKNSDIPNPQYIFVSGRKPPHIERDEKIVHKLPDDEFIKEILDMGGTQKEIFENNELLELFLPIIRKDFRIVENYKYVNKSSLDIDMIVLYGDEEKIQHNEAKQWSIHTNKSCKIFKIEGNHFFINHSSKEVVDIINNIVVNNYRRILSVG